MTTAVAFFSRLKSSKARPDRQDGQREELIEGKLFNSPAAKVWHADIVRRLRIKLATLDESRYALANDFACILATDQCLPLI